MDNEGHKSQQDVVGEVKKHPWEEKPEVVVPTSESERAEHAKINDLEKKKARRQKRQARKAKFFGFVKGHKVLSALIGVAIIAAIAGAIVGVVLLCKHIANGKPTSDTIILEGNKEDIVLKEQKDVGVIPTYVSSKMANMFINDTFIKGSTKTNTDKMEDALESYLKELNDEYEASFYRMYFGAYVTCNGDKERGGEIMKQTEKSRNLYDQRQEFMYNYSHYIYYTCLKEEKLAEEYREKMNSGYSDEEEYGL